MKTICALIHEKTVLAIDVMNHQFVHWSVSVCSCAIVSEFVAIIRQCV